MARKDPAAATEQLDAAHEKLVDLVCAEVASFAASQDDKAHLSGERRARRLTAMGRMITASRQAMRKPDRDPPPPANQNMPSQAEELEDADDFDGVGDGLADAALRADIAARLDRLARRFPDCGLFVCPGQDPPEPDAIWVASTGRRKPAARAA